MNWIFGEFKKQLDYFKKDGLVTSQLGSFFVWLSLHANKKTQETSDFAGAATCALCLGINQEPRGFDRVYQPGSCALKKLGDRRQHVLCFAG